MIIKKITIENFLCYHGIKEFELSSGLNIILGDNGEGKTKFFEALDWLFNGENRNLEQYVSAKAISDAQIKEQFKVRVSISVEQYEEKKIISKSFNVEKLNDENITINNYTVEGIEENNIGERSFVDGNILLERVFPSDIRRFSMFKGESELNVFRNDDALGILINNFSNAKHYEKYSEKSAFLREKADKAVDDATRSNTKNQIEHRRIESEIIRLSKEQNRLSVFINTIEDQIGKLEENIQDAEKYVNNAEDLETINHRIKKIEEQISHVSSSIYENYTTALFDDNWILVNFEPIHQEFSNKVSLLNTQKREMQSEFDKQLGVVEGKRQVEEELINGLIPLPKGVPSKAYMDEMLKDEWCKVCNRPAEKGSEAYLFMKKRLEEYLKSQKPEKVDSSEKEQLFSNDYISRLFNLSVSHEDNLGSLRNIRNKITELFEFNNDRKNDLTELNEKLNKELQERERIIGSSNIGAEKLSSVLKNYNNWQKELTNQNKELLSYSQQLQSITNELNQRNIEKDNIDIGSVNTFLIKTRTILRDIETIFKDTKEKKFDEFISLLQSKSNTIFQTINVDDFTGTIVFKRKSNKSTVSIELQEGGRIFHKPNQSLATSMHIAILFAISELASDLKEENFPMIFDAPTSSFGETKTKDFLNLIYQTGKQRIILFYDFIGKDDDGNQYIKPEFNQVKRHKGFWIKRKRPFDRFDLRTINTEVIQL